MAVEVDADLQVDAPGGSRQLSVDDFKAAATQAAKEATLEAARVLLTELKSLLTQIEDNTDGLELSLTDIDFNTDQVEQNLASLFAELAEKLEAGDITGLATAARQDTAQGTLEDVRDAVDADRATVRAVKAEPLPSEQWRRLVEGDVAYHGVAPDGTVNSAVWTVIVRLDESTADQLEIRSQTGLSWDNRAVGW